MPNSKPKIDPLESLRCPKGCDLRFLQYLVWEDTELRIVTSYHIGGKLIASFHDVGLRCGDCGTQYGRKGVKNEAKEALDELLATNAHVLQELADQSDTDLLQEFCGGTAEVMEARPDE